ncbi:hypothetical protein M2369_000711 [Bacillus sp. JUb11]|uniref:pyocin knob domain-containing protein n=1 Tax=Bacillus sp. JUb11 TaxID=2940595 RepID=UPI002169AB7A|nr:pyocin knob domain-containing protein [Bacillus sp. JUb11]MCS3483223.1 hypothetical protein [Bacillus sp. JUb11]
MEIKKPKLFEVSDKAHADLFNEMVKVLLENDSVLLDQIIGHTSDTQPHASAAEKKKWNESQLYKITAEDGKHLIAVPANGSVFDAIRDKGTCTFYAPPGIGDSPAPTNSSLRGIQTVGQNKIGTGFAIDTSGNAYYFYYNSDHISITWTQLPTKADKDRWNNGQLYRLTQNNGKPIYKGTSETTDYNEITDTGLYLIYNKGLNAPELIDGAFMIVVSYGTTLLQTVYETAGSKSYYRVKKTDSTWTKWTRVLTEEDIIPQSEKDKWNNGQLYKITQDSGDRKSLPTVLNGTDILSLPPGRYYAAGQYLTNMPTTNDTSWFNIDIEKANTRKNFHVIRSVDNSHWFGTVHTDGIFTSWRRVITDADLSSIWNQVTLVAGTTIKHFAGNPLKFSIRLNTLHIRGSFEGVPANETVIARFTQKPSAKTVFVGATVGSYGAARFILDTDGSLRFDGMSANDNSYVSRFELNESIPLW